MMEPMEQAIAIDGIGCQAQHFMDQLFFTNAIIRSHLLGRTQAGAH
jgi:hypothetical protein